MARRDTHAMLMPIMPLYICHLSCASPHEFTYAIYAIVYCRHAVATPLASSQRSGIARLLSHHIATLFIIAVTAPSRQMTPRHTPFTLPAAIELILRAIIHVHHFFMPTSLYY